MNEFLGANWRSTVGGILLGVPPVVTGSLTVSGIGVGKWVVFATTLAMGLGGLILGTNAKDKQVHSTAAEVQQATKAAE